MGEKIVDFAQSNLHVVSYSTPVRRLCTLAELEKHLHTLPQQPDLIPYLARQKALYVDLLVALLSRKNGSLQIKDGAMGFGE
jgi:aminopeptidase-like protein